MHPFISKYNVKPADVLVVPKNNFQIVQHYAIYLGQDEYGNDWLSENNNHVGVRLVSAYDFLNENKVISRIRRFEKNNVDREQAVKTALVHLGQPYSLINFNCEHFANIIQNGKSFSTQVGLGIAAGIALLFLFGGSGK